jgi:hypothetical protein
MHINVKWGIYAAITALLLSLLISLILGQAGFGIALLRGLAFGAIFFALGTGAWALINHYIPELLFPENDGAVNNIFGTESVDLQGSDSQLYGSRINITLGDRSDAALPDSDGPDSDEVGNIADLVSGAVDPAGEAKRQRGIDETSENSYNNLGEDTTPSPNDPAEKEPVYAEESGSFTMNFDSFTMGGGGKSLDPFGDSFSLPANATVKKEEVLPERKTIENTPKALEGDFNPKDIALGIRTVLETDKKG